MTDFKIRYGPLINCCVIFLTVFMMVFARMEFEGFSMKASRLPFLSLLMVSNLVVVGIDL